MANDRDSSIQLEAGHDATDLQSRSPSTASVSPESSDRSLRVNLFVANVTVWLMFVVGGIVMAFALLAMDELRYEYICLYLSARGLAESDILCSDDDITCGSNYIAEPDTLWRGDEQARDRFHFQCRLLYSWTYILTVAGSFSLVRTLLLAIPIRNST